MSTLPFADNRSGITSNLHSPYIECPCPALQDTKPHILNGSTAFAGRRARRGKGFEPDEACRGPFTCRHHFFTMPGNDGKNCLPCTDITSHRQELVRYLLLILPGEFRFPSGNGPFRAKWQLNNSSGHNAPRAKGPAFTA
ncbi:hypothetical protein AGRO_2437 [Agrobacterium sp. ATCC 31749]|nr:hypothetical protein AGRO_2437 [Agrobacterium sp. ATCC 31749]